MVSIRALKAFGYRSVSVLDPTGRRGPDGLAALLGKRLEIYEPEAAIVRQVFRWYADGIGVTTIVARLNGVESRRYSYTAVRNLARDASLHRAGVWNQRRFERRPGTRIKAARMLPESEWKVYDRPELRIIDDATWSAVQARIAVMRTLFPAKGLMRGKNAALHSKHLFSGFLTCGRCGGAITIVSGGAGSPR